MSRRKHEIRREMKTILQSLDRRWVEAAGRDLSARLTDLIDNRLSQRISHILAYAAFFPGEVDLMPFISEQIGRRKVYLPRLLPEQRMAFVNLDKEWLLKMEPGLHGLPVPELDGAQLYNPQDVNETLVLVPGIAFDREGNRLGRGKGYYNTFLRPPMTSALKIGVCWSLQMLPEVPSDAEHAIMDWVCHEEGLVETGVKFEEEME